MCEDKPLRFTVTHPECRAAEELARRRAGSIPTRDRRAGMR